jgi:hypothetical protein
VLFFGVTPARKEELAVPQYFQAKCLLNESAAVPNDGKALEALVALIEKLHLPEGFKISPNKRVYNRDGIQVAELDVLVEGRLGTTDLKWLIECRDRPSEGPAPCSWIEQLITRKERLKLNKVIAVSTTGFAAGVPELAEFGRIELREVRSLTQADVASWLLVETMPVIEPLSRLIRAVLYAADEEPEARRKLFDEIVRSKSNEPILWQTEHKEHHTIHQAFRGVLLEKNEVFNAVEYNAPARPAIIQVFYPNDDSHFIVHTELGDVRVVRIDFHAELSVRKTEIPMARLSDYVRSDSGDSIAQSAAFECFALGYQLSFEMHKLGESGETQIVLRTLGPATNAE